MLAHWIRMVRAERFELPTSIPFSRIRDSTKVRRCKNTGGHTSGQYYRDRVLGATQSTGGGPPKRQWDETLHGNTPNPGWTPRLGDTGSPRSPGIWTGPPPANADTQ
jgi:hypothetical protein